MRDIQERLQELNKLKAKIVRKEALLKEQKRKERTRQLIEYGSLVVKAGIHAWDQKTLLGAFLEIAQKGKNEAEREKWYQEGRRLLDQEEERKQPLVLRFEEKPDHEARKELRTLGFRWNKIRQSWEGLVLQDKAQQLAQKYHGELKPLKD